MFAERYHKCVREDGMGRSLLRHLPNKYISVCATGNRSLMTVRDQTKMMNMAVTNRCCFTNKLKIEKACSYVSEAPSCKR